VLELKEKQLVTDWKRLFREELRNVYWVIKEVETRKTCSWRRNFLFDTTFYSLTTNIRKIRQHIWACSHQAVFRYAPQEYIEWLV